MDKRKEGNKSSRPKDMECVHGWSDCYECANEIDCRMGRYKGESAIEKAASIAEEIVQKEAVESVRKIKERRGCKAYTDMDRFYSWHTYGLHYKEAIPLDGSIAPGGGSKAGKKAKKPPKKNPFDYLRAEA